MTIQRTVVLGLFWVCVLGTQAAAQSTLACPIVSSNTSFTGTGLQSDCAAGTTPCTTKTGISWDGTNNVLSLPVSAGNFQSPPGSAVAANVYFAAPADYDRDGWDDFAAADSFDKIYMMRNQTITCSTGSCSGSSSVAPTVQTIAASWWTTLTHVRPAAFRARTTTGGSDAPLKTGFTSNYPSGLTAGGTGFGMTPMAAGDFDGDGWPDFVAISNTTYDGSGIIMWPTAARLYLNTKNCHLTADTAPNIAPCGIGALCTNQDTNGACHVSSGGAVTNGTAYAESNLSCTNTNTCPYYRPTFATYDLKTGAAVSSVGGAALSTPTTTTPGDFGPIGHPVQNMVVVDWDGDGDLDILYGHSTGTCPGSLCSTAGYKFFAGIDVWKNDCAQSAQWSAASKSCAGHIPQFSHTMGTGTCTGTGNAACANADTLYPSTSHNTTTVNPNTNFGFDVSGKEAPGFAYVDIDADGDLDLVVGSPGCCQTNGNEGKRLRIFKGTSNSATVHTLDTANPLVLSTNSAGHPGFQGGLTGVFVYDFSGDGYPDIITGSDSFGYDSNNGGRTRYWKNTGVAATPFGTAWPTCSATPSTCASCSATCNPDATTKISESCGDNSCTKNLGATPPTFPDFDMGLLLDYDHDPYSTKDIVFTNGNTSDEFYIFPNRADSANYAGCGTAASGTLAIPNSELTVSGACITPSSTTPAGTSITYQLNNESPANWVTACTQTSTGYSPALVGGQCCVTFPNITGRSVQWQAKFDANTADAGGCTAGTTSPTITSVGANYTYTSASQHYKAGVIVSDGVSYVGSFTQPGNRGHLYATAAGLTTTYYDFATKLDALATRYIYTADNTGATSVSRITFSPTSPSTTLQSRVGASSAAEATNIINWVLSARFGINNSGTAPTKLGAVLDSTPAILNKPYRPTWYSFLTSSDKTLYDTFTTAQSTRVPLLLFASMDGMIHAVMTIPTLIADTHNGQEAWAFVPPFIASSMKSDYTSSCTPSCAAGTLAITSYPDGSPTLLDYKKASGTIATAAIIGDGGGGTSVTALDVTSTVAASPSFATSGPTPMWSWQPGGAAAGKAISKSGVARTLISGVEKFVVVTGTGINAADASKGKIVSGYNLETGAKLWDFEMQCALTSDITIFETDDTGETGLPQIDGYADRAVFADYCGNVYKINPGQDLSGGYMDNTGYGTISIGLSNGKNRYALFSTTSTSGAIGAARPIANAIGAKTDTTTDMVLFFGTGGLETFDTTQTNEFYAVYAKNGTIRNKITGSCTSSPVKCEKFYGGVVITPDTVILSKSTDAVIGGVGACDFGTTHIMFRALNTLASVQDITQIASQAIAAVSGPLYGDAGAIYFATVSGEVKRLGQPRASTAGADSAGGTLNGMGATELTGANSPFTLMGWRVVL
ncbi:MAG: Tfp pilus assembly protein tip-associated adhesin PilY1-like protein [Myxococcales bacterium]|nr:Tfp pilus assembly protein tip-associated adhesin PilY1-like protein [Myxococcales bacterium]